MNFTRTLSATLLALVTSTSALAANLTIPMSFEYLALDGKEIDTNKFTHKSDLDLSNGSHKIAIRYHDMIEDDFSDSQSFIKSAPFIVTIMVDGDHEYLLKPADGEFVKRPKSFAKDPQVIISRQDNGTVDYTITQTDFKEGSFLGGLFGSNKGDDIDALAASATSSNVAPAAVNTATATTAAVTATTVVASTPAAATVSATPTTSPVADKAATHPEQMLQYWWLQADEQTRKEFMSWAIKQL
ncbi:DUF2057 domain-containing protein [Shewanella sp. UCD-KL21]|uniref:DUF2057 domain-containing protein n=1 Tax=Shewanella sp. UCD-KL21 TaxID=1917164 RepID=UPI000970886A|nr:DUF2057 domain-containing protein [Shewanella sp. UCD-KL21]